MSKKLPGSWCITDTKCTIYNIDKAETDSINIEELQVYKEISDEIAEKLNAKATYTTQSQDAVKFYISWPKYKIKYGTDGMPCMALLFKKGGSGDVNVEISSTLHIITQDKVGKIFSLQNPNMLDDIITYIDIVLDLTDEREVNKYLFKATTWRDKLKREIDPIVIPLLCSLVMAVAGITWMISK